MIARDIIERNNKIISINKAILIDKVADLICKRKTETYLRKRNKWDNHTPFEYDEIYSKFARSSMLEAEDKVNFWIKLSEEYEKERT